MGAGAAGLLAAITAARSGRQVLLLESTRDGGRKILISGGGRCNILPSEAAPERYVTDSSPHTLRKILKSWPLADQIAFFEKELGQALVREPDTGKLFPASNRARDVRDRLVARAKESGAVIRFEAGVDAIAPMGPAAAASWAVTLQDGTTIAAGALVLATGGLSVPATGSKGKGLEFMKTLGVDVHATYPALTPLVLEPPVHAHLAGVSLSVTIRVPGARPRFETTGGFLVTHRGYSGPTVLDVSHLAIRSQETGDRVQVQVQWTPKSAAEWDQLLIDSTGSVHALLERELPKRLANQLALESGIEGSVKLSQLDRTSRKRLVTLLCAYPLQWTGDEGYKKAEVTGGGVALSAVDPRTLEVRGHAGLFLCGEILDAFGPIGGHNFMWAWSTGRAAGDGAARHGLAPH